MPVAIIVLLGVLAAWLYALQRQFVRMCREAADPTRMPSLELFAKSPFGVPAGTVRALLAKSIVFGSVAYMAVTVATGQEFPQILVGLLGTVLGFYFGSRSAGASGSAEAYEEVGVAKRQRDLAIEESKRSELGEVIAGITVATVVGGAPSRRIPRTAEKGFAARARLPQPKGALVPPNR